jgi:hypothetical protein
MGSESAAPSESWHFLFLVTNLTFDLNSGEESSHFIMTSVGMSVVFSFLRCQGDDQRDGKVQVGWREREGSVHYDYMPVSISRTHIAYL